MSKYLISLSTNSSLHEKHWKCCFPAQMILNSILYLSTSYSISSVGGRHQAIVFRATLLSWELIPVQLSLLSFLQSQEVSGSEMSAKRTGCLEPGCWQNDKKVKTVVTVQLMSNPLFDVCRWMMHINRVGALMAWLWPTFFFFFTSFSPVGTSFWRTTVIGTLSYALRF